MISVSDYALCYSKLCINDISLQCNTVIIFALLVKGKTGALICVVFAGSPV